MNIEKLKKKAANLRKKTFMAFIEKGEAHLGGSFSMIESLLTIYEMILKKNDKFILSKAHASFPLCILLKEKGFNPEIKTHLEIDLKNGIHCTTGSLGHGLPIATGMAFARKKQKIKGKIYVIIVDYNKIQALSKLEDALPLNNLSNKFKAFNSNCIEIKDGHSFKDLIKGFKKLKNLGKPNVIILNTIKGKGIKEFENDPVWHARQLKGDEMDLGKKRLGIK